MMTRPIAISLSPNTESCDALNAVKILLVPWKWIQGSAQDKVRSWFMSYFNKENVYLFNSGRSAFYCLLKAFNIGKNDEVLVQAFTCVAVAGVVMWAGATPVYVDIEKKTFNIDLDDIEKKITKRTKAIVMQHAFGIPADTVKIMAIAKKYKLLVIEDCALSLGAKVNGKKVGSFGDAAFFSFGRDKVISSVFGGAAMLNIRNEEITSRLQNEVEKLTYPSMMWILQQLLHPIMFSFILPLYDVLSIGKVILFVSQKLKLLSFPVCKQEYYGEKPLLFPALYPNALACLLTNQLYKLERYNEKRIKLAKMYGNVRKGAIYLRYPILVNNPDIIYKRAKKRGILLGTWYSNVIDPKQVNTACVQYTRTSCPVAERVAKQILNLPTYPTLSKKNVQKVINIIYQ